MTTNALYPWQSTQWRMVHSAYQQNRLAHALLLTGLYGLGKTAFARECGRLVLCQSTELSQKPCGYCRSCHWMQAGSHPDFLQIAPEKTGQAIKIDDIRSLIETVQHSALQGGYRVIVIHSANAMNLAASNALLKVLEEPPENTLLILITQEGQSLLPTIQSRCQKIHFYKPNQTMALEWLSACEKVNDSSMDPRLLLSIANGAPLRVLEILDSEYLSLRQTVYQALWNIHTLEPVSLAEQWKEKENQSIWHLWLSGLHDIVRLQLTHGRATLINEDYRDCLMNVQRSIPIGHTFACIERIQSVLKAYARGIHLNATLALEACLIDWKQGVIG